MLIFWDAFEKEAKKHKPNVFLERIRRGLPLYMKGHSKKNLSSTAVGKALRRLK